MGAARGRRGGFRFPACLPGVQGRERRRRQGPGQGCVAYPQHEVFLPGPRVVGAQRGDLSAQAPQFRGSIVVHAALPGRNRPQARTTAKITMRTLKVSANARAGPRCGRSNATAAPMATQTATDAATAGTPVVTA